MIAREARSDRIARAVTERGLMELRIEDRVEVRSIAPPWARSNAIARRAAVVHNGAARRDLIIGIEAATREATAEAGEAASREAEVAVSGVVVAGAEGS